ncbi:hypothetical protein D3C76_1033720 [compost metagenome]
MKYRKLALVGVAVLLSACGKEADVCAGSDVKDQLVKVFTDGPLAGHVSALKQSELRDVAIIEKDPDSGVVACVGTLSVPVGDKRVEGILQYRIAPVAESDYDYLLLDANAERASALAGRIQQAFRK